MARSMLAVDSMSGRYGSAKPSWAGSFVFGGFALVVIACGARIEPYPEHGSASDEPQVGKARPTSDSTLDTEGANEPASDTTSGDGANARTSGASADVRHADCQQPFPEVPPAVPEVRADAVGWPLFDLWRDIECDDLDIGLCDDNADFCFRGTPDAEVGVMAPEDIDVSCDGEGEVVGYDFGRCWMCAPEQTHARACCEGLEGFDCRAWPFDANSAPGMICARHEDCEAGLICGRGGEYASGYGICQCPGVTLQLPDHCEYLWSYL